MRIVTADLPHLEGITEIYNEAISNTTATFDTEMKTLENRKEWLKQHSAKYPVLVMLDNQNTVAGWASLSRWSDRSAYDDTAEISVYIHPFYRKNGLGTQLMKALLDEGSKGGLHCILSRITEGNEHSIYLHEKFGFEKVGVLKEVGKKFGKLLDVTIMQLLLK